MPFAEGSRGCHALLGLDTQNLNAKERHFILPLVCGPLLCNPSLLLLYHQKFVQRLFSLKIKDQTYLGAILIALCTDDNLLEGSCSIPR